MGLASIPAAAGALLSAGAMAKGQAMVWEALLSDTTKAAELPPDIISGSARMFGRDWERRVEIAMDVAGIFLGGREAFNDRNDVGRVAEIMMGVMDLANALGGQDENGNDIRGDYNTSTDNSQQDPQNPGTQAPNTMVAYFGLNNLTSLLGTQVLSTPTGGLFYGSGGWYSTGAGGIYGAVSGSGATAIASHGPYSLSQALMALSMGYMPLGGTGGFGPLAHSDYD